MSDERPASSEEAAEIVRNDPALSVATDEASTPSSDDSEDSEDED
jgi:hypothetical protein